MYFPYLYGRRAELLALRDVTADLAAWKTVPVIEPTNTNPGDLVRCLTNLEDNGAACFLVVNPSQGEFKAGAVVDWSSALARFVGNPAVVRPTFQVFGMADRPALLAFLAGNAHRPIGVVVRSAEFPPALIAADLAGADVVVFLHARSNPTDYSRAFTPGFTVEVESRFNVQARNADYAGSEWFTSSHQNFHAAGLLGFSDFGPLPPTFSLTGGQAAAVAIHMSYENGDGSIWVQHFVSDSVDLGDGDASSKLAEATSKLVAAVAADPTKFVDSPGLKQYLSQDARREPTNLTMNKRQQISHHLSTVGPLL